MVSRHFWNSCKMRYTLSHCWELLGMWHVRRIQARMKNLKFIRIDRVVGLVVAECHIEEILKVYSSTCPPQAQLQTSGNTEQIISNFSEHLQNLYIPGQYKFCDWIHRIDTRIHIRCRTNKSRKEFLWCSLSRQPIESSHLRHKCPKIEESHNTTLTPCQCSSVSCR